MLAAFLSVAWYSWTQLPEVLVAPSANTNNGCSAARKTASFESSMLSL